MTHPPTCLAAASPSQHRPQPNEPPPPSRRAPHPHRPAPPTAALLAHLQALYAEARADNLPPPLAARRAAHQPFLSHPDHAVPPNSPPPSLSCNHLPAKPNSSANVSNIPDTAPSPSAPQPCPKHTHQVAVTPSPPAQEPMDRLRRELSHLHHRDKMSACQTILMSSYKRSKTLELHANIRSLFETQYTPTRRPAPISSSALSSPSLSTPQSPTAPTVPKKKKKIELLGCQHYIRNCKLKAACCGLFVTCRVCHDEAMTDDHEMDRFATETILCMVCLTEQSVSPHCIRCQTEFAHYFCSECRFFENTPGKKVYHCHRCKVCRLGEGLGIDLYHCDNCDACVALKTKADHRCLSNALHANCPVCRGYLFTSTEPVLFMRCGHTMHSQCFDDYTRGSYQCPLCMRSLTNMDKYFEQIDELLRSEPMPPEFKHKRSLILCNDCGQKCVAKYHFMYHKCNSEACRSYNTNVLETFNVEASVDKTGAAAVSPDCLHSDEQQHNSNTFSAMEEPRADGVSNALPSSTARTLGGVNEHSGHVPFRLESPYVVGSLDGGGERAVADEGQFATSPVQGTVRG